MYNNVKLYKLYNIKDKRDYEGSIEKCECSIKGEYGIFKERISMQSIDNVMEEVVYMIANITGVNCSFASCRKHNNIIGSFSRYEIPYGYEFEHLSTLVKRDELPVDELLDYAINLSKMSKYNIIYELYKYIILDYIVGQRDRHLANLAVIYKKVNNKILDFKLYNLYDNGLCCFASDSSDNRIQFLNNKFYSSRIGSNEEIISAIYQYRDRIYTNDLIYLVHYEKLNSSNLDYYISKADKYRQINKSCKRAIIDFILSNCWDIHNVNIRNSNFMEELYVHK